MRDSADRRAFSRQLAAERCADAASDEASCRSGALIAVPQATLLWARGRARSAAAYRSSEEPKPMTLLSVSFSARESGRALKRPNCVFVESPSSTSHSWQTAPKERCVLPSGCVGRSTEGRSCSGVAGHDGHEGDEDSVAPRLLIERCCPPGSSGPVDDIRRPMALPLGFQRACSAASSSI